MTTDIQLNDKDLEGFYRQYFPYYLSLDAEAAKRFIKRCLEFVSRKKIRGAAGLRVSNSMKAIVAASAVQLTLGLDDWDLSYFGTILIHQSDYDHASGLKFSGETNLGGTVKLSWRKFIEGYKVHGDNLNLGLHEFTHALSLNRFRGHRQDYFVEHYYTAWFVAGRPVFEKIRRNEPTIFRKYGGTNITEFFSVVVEHFFESPQEFAQTHPGFYKATAILLNQIHEVGRTRLNIRKELFEKQAIELPEAEFRAVGRTEAKLLGCLLAALASVYFFAVGNMMVPGIVTGLASVLLYLLFDYHYSRISIGGKMVRITRGLALFKGRNTVEIPSSQLILVSRDSPETATITYYNHHNEFFYRKKYRANSETALDTVVAIFGGG